MVPADGLSSTSASGPAARSRLSGKGLLAALLRNTLGAAAAHTGTESCPRKGVRPGVEETLRTAATWQNITPPCRVDNAIAHPWLVMGIDALAPSITLVNPETGKGRVTYLCEGQPAQLFVPTPGLWFSTQPPEVSPT